MLIKKYYRRFIADVRKSALNDNLRYQIQYRYMLKILLVVVAVSALINLTTERYTMGILMLILAVIYFLFYMIVYKLKDKGVKIVTKLMAVLSMGISVGVLLQGTTGGVAPIWVLLFPILSVLLTGKRIGLSCSTVLFGIIIFLYWTPFGHQMLNHDYDIIFLERYPLIYFVMLVVALLYETLRGTMVDELQRQRTQMESVYQNQYHSMESRIHEAKKIRHDLRHHFVMISQYLNDGQIEEAQNYIDQYYKALPFEEALTYCEHYATNALLTYYGQVAKEKEIPFEVKLHMPKDISIKTEDLTVVFGNLLENALHASEDGMLESVDFKPWIKINGNFDGGSFTLAVKNASLHEAKTNEKGQYISTKHDGIGIGVRSVSDMVDKYEGLFRIEQTPGVYSTSLVMYANDPN